MKKIWVILFLFLLGAETFAGPEIHFEKLNLDVGALHPNSREKIVFRFKNTGDAPLEIRKVHAACGCTVPRLSQSVLAPGESGQLVLLFYTAGYYGPVTKTATLLTNCRENPTVTVSFSGEVKTELLPDKTKIDFTDMVPGKRVEKNIIIKNRMGRPVKLGKGEILFGAEHVRECGVSWKVNTLKGGDLSLTLSARLAPGLTGSRPIRMKLGFKTNSKLDPQLIFYITIRPLPPIMVSPGSLFLSALSPGGKHVAEIHVNSNGGQSLTVDELKISSLPFSYEVETLSETAFVIRLNVNSSARPGRFQGSLQLFVTVAGQQRMRIIPVKGQIL